MRMALYYLLIDQLNPQLKCIQKIFLMKLAQIIENLSTIVEHKPPVEAIRLAKENWQNFLPVITVLMDKFHEVKLTEQENNLLFIGILLLVEMQQYDQFEGFIKLCDGDDEYAAPLGHLLGDSVTEGLSSYFYILAINGILIKQRCWHCTMIIILNLH